MLALIIGQLSVCPPAQAHSPAVVDLLRLGDQALGQGRPSEASKVYAEALKLEPDSPDVHNQLGLAYERQNLLLEAAGEFRKALELKPDFLPSLNNMGSVMYRKGNYDSAITYYQKALDAKHGEDTEVLTNLASVYRDRATFVGGPSRDTDFKAALDDYHGALRLDPNFAPAHNNLGLCELRLRHFDQAEEEINRAIALKPDYAAAYFNLGIVEEAKNQLPQAIAAFQNSLRYETVPAYIEGTRRKIKELGVPQNNLNHFHLAFDLIQKKQWSEAEAELRKELATGNGARNAVAWNNLGYVLMKQGRYRDAIQSYNKAITLQPGKLPQAEYNLGQALFHTGDLSGAEKALKKAIADAHGTHALAHNALGMVYKQRGDNKKAQAEYRVAIMQSGDSLPVVHYNLGLLYERQAGRQKEALDEYNSYLAQEPNGYNAGSAHEKVQTLKEHR